MNNLILMLQSFVLIPDIIMAGARVIPIIVKDAWQREKTVVYYDGD